MAIETTVPVQEQKQFGLKPLLKKCFSFPVLLGALVIGFNAVIMLPLFRLEPDTWWHIKLGQQILVTGHWLKADIYSFTAYGNNPLAYEWLGEVVLWLAYKIGGLKGLQILLFGLTSTILVLAYYLGCLRSRNSKSAFAATIAIAPLAAMTFTLRPQLLGYILLLITLIILERYRAGLQKSLWILPPLFLIWVNTHGSFILGYCILGLYWFCGLRRFEVGGLRMEPWTKKQRIHIEIVFLLSCLTLPITPFGGQAAVFPIEKALYFPQQAAHIEEWLSLNFSLWEPKLMLLLLLGFLLVQVTHRLNFRVEDLFLVFFTAYMTCVHTRFVIIFALIFAPMAALVLANWLPAYEPEKDKPVINAVLIMAIALGVVHAVPSRKHLAKIVSEKFPVAAVHYLKEHSVPRPMYNAYAFGGYLLWAMGPKHKVFIDGRGDFYERAGVFSDYIKIQNIRPEALAILHTYHVNSCMVKRNGPLATLLSVRPNWKEIYKDSLSAIFVRTPALESVATAGQDRTDPHLKHNSATVHSGVP